MSAGNAGGERTVPAATLAQRDDAWLLSEMRKFRAAAADSRERAARSESDVYRLQNERAAAQFQAEADKFDRILSRLASTPTEAP